MDIEKLRAEAELLANKGDFQMRSCHRCNSAHDYLTNESDGPLVVCFDCGNWYLKGVDITYED